MLNNIKEKKLLTKSLVLNDIILIVSLLLIAAVGMLYFFVFRGPGDTIKVTVDGKTYGTYSLSQNIVEDIFTGENGEYYNRFVIQDGKAYVEKATCPDGICVKHSPIFRNGESIICLPQRVVITVITRDADDGPDVII